MQVRFLGFRLWTENQVLDLSAYVDFMKSNNGSPYKIGDYNRHVYFNNTFSPDYYVGLLVTAKNQKRFCELLDQAGNLTIKVNDLDPNSNLMDFNFFVVNKKSGFGMYQHYFQSCSLNTFGTYNIRKFAEFRKKRQDEIVSAILGSQNKKQTKRGLKGGLEFQMLVRQENLESLIEEFHRVKFFEYSFISLTVDEPTFGPIKDYSDLSHGLPRLQSEPKIV